MKMTLVALALVPLAAAAAPPPVLSGLYSVGELGLVEFSVADGRAVGRLKAAELCGFAADTQVISGGFEGDVFVGTATICQSGPGCPAQRTYPMLGVFHEDAVAGWIHLDPGCESSVLDSGLLFFRPATIDERQKVATTTSAAALAQKQGKGDPMVQAGEAVSDGQHLAQEGKYGPAREKFRQAIALDDGRWEALLGYGMAEARLGHPERSFSYFDKAQAAATAKKVPASEVAQIHYQRACAQVALGEKKAAIASLKLALKAPSATLLESLKVDAELAPIRDDAEFRQLVANAQLQQYRKKPR